MFGDLKKNGLVLYWRTKPYRSYAVLRIKDGSSVVDVEVDRVTGVPTLFKVWGSCTFNELPDAIDLLRAAGVPDAREHIVACIRTALPRALKK